MLGWWHLVTTCWLSLCVIDPLVWMFSPGDSWPHPQQGQHLSEQRQGELIIVPTSPPESQRADEAPAIVQLWEMSRFADCLIRTPVTVEKVQSVVSSEFLKYNWPEPGTDESLPWQCKDETKAWRISALAPTSVMSLCVLVHSRILAWSAQNVTSTRKCVAVCKLKTMWKRSAQNARDQRKHCNSFPKPQTG